MSEEILENNDETLGELSPQTSEKVYLIIWKEDSPNPGFIEHVKFKESELCDHNKEEVLGPYREYVEAIPGSKLWHLFIDASEVDSEHELFNYRASHWDWSLQDVVINEIPPITWDDVRFARNQMLAASDNMFNIDTPDEIKQQWIDHRKLLRELIDREQAAGRTPDTVFWNDYLPPFPASARGGLTEDEAKKCVWYVAPSKPSKSK